MRTGGSELLSPDLPQQAFDIFLTAIEDEPPGAFERRENYGHCHLTVAAGYLGKGEQEQWSVRLSAFNFAGFSREEITDCVTRLKEIHNENNDAF